MNQHRFHVYLYEEPTAPTLDLLHLSRYVEEILPNLQVEARESFLKAHLPPSPQQEETLSRLAERFAGAKVRNPTRREEHFVPLPGEIAYERRRLVNPQTKAWGILYDGFEFMDILQELLPKEERTLSHIHIAFTNQLFGTWSEDDRRYHARVIICGFPSLISTSGIVEAPAKPKSYYFLKRQYAALGMQNAPEASLDSQFRGRFIEYGDQRLTEVMKGYVMQAILYNLWGEPFCEDKGCRLYNAHWQEEVIQAQLESKYEFCPSHQRKLEQLKGAI